VYVCVIGSLGACPVFWENASSAEFSQIHDKHTHAHTRIHTHTSTR